ncbi:peptidyl-dipeptidase Dcp [Williamwhitmania taraxaci]|uniref:Peptidyl-dipeptidase Dcp n=2 Tax=Williamwhitmania taraxaci TaxID=1640674 RepID=A0A1G6IVA4_9BACT|nr:M3 family metallopeptidase [Williamwhitmania taraxaci]SDC10437.1 peptidyl-dipeptidase Dcp [Williamwhitmania taraxaci]
MKKNLILALLAGMALTSCNKGGGDSENPFFSEYETPFGVPAFDKIKTEHYLPAFKEGIKQQQAEIASIVKNTEAPTFENTILAMENSGGLLDRVSGVFLNITESNSTDTIQAIADSVAPLLSKNNDDIYLNAELFQKVKVINDQKAQLSLNQEQKMLLDKIYKNFVRGGANLDSSKQARFREVNGKLALLELQFSKNQLKENDGFKLVIDNKDDLIGLPESIIMAAAEQAKADKMDGKWVFTLSKPSLIPFITYSQKRELREKIYMAYANRANNKNDYNNNPVIAKILPLTLEKAQLLGFSSFAHFMLDNTMAKTPENVYNLLNQIWTPAIKKANEEVADMQQMIAKEGGKFKLASWDWWYYSEKVRKEKYALDEEMLRPYFKLENVREGIFYMAKKLYGLTFEGNKTLPKYDPSAVSFEVKDSTGNLLAILYMDYFPRPSKRGGAWCTNFRNEKIVDGKRIAPVVSIVTNFTKPVGDQPALLNYDEVSTLFHEFGHALHAMQTKVTYGSLSGTSVARDFVELPSQISENWASEPEMLQVYAKHYKTGEVIPAELIEKMKKSGTFNQGFVTTEYLAASYLDLGLYADTMLAGFDAQKFEKTTMDKLGLIPEILPRYRSTYFGHIFGGGYATGYYSYIWAEVLDADAFNAFKETGNIFDKKTATSFLQNVLEKGGTEEAMDLYKAFRGKEPNIDPLLIRRGLK